MDNKGIMVRGVGKLGLSAELIGTSEQIIHGQRVKIKHYSSPFLTIDGEKAVKVLAERADEDNGERGGSNG